MKLVLFDIDSTLLKDGGAAHAAFNTAFIELFGSEPAGVDKHGKTDPAIAQETAMATIGRELTEAEAGRLYSRYCELFQDFLEKSKAFYIMNGALELCKRLSSDPSFLLGLQTGNFEINARAKLLKAGLNTYFHFGGFASDSPDRTQLVKIGIDRGFAILGPAVHDAGVFVIGDSLQDVIAGNANNAFTIGVTTGKDSADDFVAANADAIVADLTEASGIYELLRP